MNISIAEAHDRLSYLLKQVQNAPITITRRGKAVGVLLSTEEYQRLCRLEAYNQVVQLSQSLRESGVSASELYRASRDELEDRQ
jgi:prevent-host-death family protein